MNAAKQQVEQNRSPTNDAYKNLVEIYNQQMPENLRSYQEGVRAGIRYALIATGEKIEGINYEKGSSEI